MYPLVDAYGSACLTIGMEAALRAIAEPRRLEILRLVSRVEMPAGEIASHFRVTRPAVSQHLAVLKEAGLLAERRDGTKRLYRARPEKLAELRDYLDDMWMLSLDRLKAAAEEQQRKERSRDNPGRPDRRARGAHRRRT